MFHQRTNEKNSGKADLLIVILFFVMMITAGYVINAFKAMPQPVNMIGQVASCAVMAGIIYLVYRLRIMDYRYSIILELPLDEAHEAVYHSEDMSYPAGTLFFERMVADKGKPLLAVRPEEMVNLVQPGEGTAAKINGVREHFSVKGKKNCHALIFERDGRLNAVYFTPNEELACHIMNYIGEK